MDVSADLPNFAVSISQAMVSQNIEMAVAVLVVAAMLAGLSTGQSDQVFRASVLGLILYVSWKMREAIW